MTASSKKKIVTRKPKAKPLTEQAADLAKVIKDKVSAAVAFVAVYENVRPILVKHEGIHDDDPSTPLLEPTPDPSGWFTLGYGHLIIDPSTGSRIPNNRAGKRRVRELYPEGITLEDADTLLQGDCYGRFIQLYSHQVYRDLEVYQQAALLSFAYNIGVHGLLKSTVWRMLTSGADLTESMADPADLLNHVKARAKLHTLDQAFTAWSRTTTSRGIRVLSKGLFFRRLAEYLVFLGTDPDDANEQARLITKAATKNV